MSEAEKPGGMDPISARLQSSATNADAAEDAQETLRTGESSSSGAVEACGHEQEKHALPGDAAVDDLDSVSDVETASSVPMVDAEELAEWNEQVRRRMRQQTRRSFMIGGAAALASLGGWYWLMSRRRDNGLPWPLRRGLEINEQFARDYYRPRRMAPNSGGKAPLQDRVNGDLGMEDPVDLNSWRLRVEGLADEEDALELPLAAIKKLPRVAVTLEFKCIEGWSIVTQWAGARFSQFMSAYPPGTLSGGPLDLNKNPSDLPPYVGLETPDSGYYVGLEMESMLHPQTLLAYEMNGAALTDDHGAPLRLVTPTKYGVKSIKRIGTIRYRRERPPDYWAQRGYDWYIGL